MKSNDKKTLHSKTMNELTALLKEKREQLVKVRMELALRKTKNVHAAESIRNDIAVIESLKRQKELTNG